jgi:hypothetical protein
MNMYPHRNDQEFIYEQLLLVVFVGLGPQMPGILLRPPCAEAASLQEHQPESQWHHFGLSERV